MLIADSTSTFDPGQPCTCLLESRKRQPVNRQDLLDFRRRYVGPSLSLAYEKPLKIVRGSGQYLYDDEGREYLDAVNNVCHVGHCHPTVVEAAHRQASMLNTNTRYLHDHLVDYAKRLCDKLPDALSVCYLVCSGSEANDLGLRMARTHSGNTDVIVVDGAYHGNTTTLIGIMAEVPTWVIVSCALAMGLGTVMGGWKIIKTLGMNIVKLEPVHGFVAETGAGVVLMAAAHIGLPVSTTHTITSSIMGVGAVRGLSAVKWGVTKRIMYAWLCTLPGAGLLAILIYLILS